MSAIEAATRLLDSYKPTPSKSMEAYFAKLPEGERELAVLKWKAEQEQQLINFITNMMKQMHENRMAIINNMR
ncbi:hypothetical protein ATI61_101492 [Archangium gephyra]|uniref:Uncharacterized protein n=1 Tax=Archangium gephyra TaxID=48 RepID=A0ABX9KBT8_9BACT|nr:hypothetical protein [Archangium gephyra]REG37506.1 hypothetical protein ATI61_101492 [Archangium gephyra]